MTAVWVLQVWINRDDSFVDGVYSSPEKAMEAYSRGGLRAVHWEPDVKNPGSWKCDDAVIEHHVVDEDP